MTPETIFMRLFPLEVCADICGLVLLAVNLPLAATMLALGVCTRLVCLAAIWWSDDNE